MKILKFNLDDAPEDATEFFASLLREATKLGFMTPNFDLTTPNEDGTPVIHRDDVFESFVSVYAETFFRGGPNYLLSKYGSRCMLTDKELSPAQKKKALRIKQRRARKSKD